MKLSIVLINHNTLELLQQCLDHLEHVVEYSGVEVIVVDNGSTDGSVQWLRAQDGDRVRAVMSAENLGFAGGCNLGIRACCGDYVLLLNTDAFPKPGALDVLMHYMETHPRVAIAGPQLLFSNGGWQRSGGRVPSPRSAMLDALGVTSAGHMISSALWRLSGRWWRARSVGYVDGACMLIRRTVLDRLGGLDERFFMFMEDAEYCYRVRQHGWCVSYVPQSHVVHLRGGSSGKKGLASTVQMRRRSESQFILRLWGEPALKRYLRWRRLNFRWRMLVASVFKNEARELQYKIAWQAYRQETL